MVGRKVDPFTLKALAVAVSLGLPLSVVSDSGNTVIEIGPELSASLDSLLNVVTLILVIFFGDRLTKMKRGVDAANAKIDNRD